MKFNYPFNKWDKDKIIDIIQKNGFIFDDEYGGIFDFHHKDANRTDKFHLNYLLYLRRTIMFVCNPNIRISPAIKSHKQLDNFLKGEKIAKYNNMTFEELMTAWNIQ